MKITKINMLLGASLAVLALPAVASAQDATGALPEVTSEVVSDEELNAAQNAETMLVAAQVEALQAQINELKKGIALASPSWKGAPEWADKEKGWKFKVRGRFMYDVAYISDPFPTAAASKAASSGSEMGFNSRVRRARLGVEGTMPGGFSYKWEADFANNAVSWADAFVEWKGKGPVSVRAGHFETFQSLEQITSSRHITFVERAQMNDAFSHGRRLGVAIGYDKGDVLARAGIFNDTINSDLNNDEWLFGARIVYAPKMGSNQLHFGANFQYRKFNTQVLSAQYRARPFLQTTGIRFVDTTAFAAKNDRVFGAEAAGVFGSLHVAAEAQWLKSNAMLASQVSALPVTQGTTASNRLASDPSFMSFYVEAGYWLTGETRGYKKGEWDRTKVNKPFNEGGLGAIGVNLRYDYLDLQNAALRANGTGTNLTNGGTQTGYLASIIWQPIDFVRVTAQYAHADIEGGRLIDEQQGQISSSTAGIFNRSYGVDTIAMRIAYDF